MRNPKWHRDEIILALELYFRTELGQIHARNHEVIELSEILNKLPIHEFRPDSVKFRNPNGVGLKLSNFLAIDPEYHGKGMEAYSKLDYEVFIEFVNDRVRLTKIAKQIKKTIQNYKTTLDLFRIGEQEDHELSKAKEGLVIFKLHKLRERDGSINNRKKTRELKEKGKLECEVCGFDFHKVYGEIGSGFIECHHIKPLSEISSEVTTTMKDLALVCSNCHRMLHRKVDTITTNDLKILMKNGSQHSV